MAPTVLENDTMKQFGVELVGRSDELRDEFYAVSVEKRISHPCVIAITQTARDALFND
jgi:LysR family transcriptional activator of nhaA